MFEKYHIPLDKWVSLILDWIVTNYRPFFQALKAPVELTLDGFESLLGSLHPLVVIAVLTIISWKTRGKGLAVGTFCSLLFVGFLGLWQETMTTLAMVLSSVLFCVLVGIPMGVLAAQTPRFDKVLKPILDGMQTTPAFVYLVPIVMLFSIGNVAAVIATVVFAVPPIVRLTTLGIRQVDKELVEAAKAFGATNKQLLFKVQFPLAMPSILAGLNQTIMMALSMVVVSSLIGAGGLGSPVIQGLNTLDIGLAVNGGISIVLLAVVLDRITQAIANKKEKK